MSCWRWCCDNRKIVQLAKLILDCNNQVLYCKFLKRLRKCTEQLEGIIAHKTNLGLKFENFLF